MDHCGGDDPFHLHEPWATYKCFFIEWSSSYVALRIYDKLTVKIKQFQTNDPFKQDLKIYSF